MKQYNVGYTISVPRIPPSQNSKIWTERWHRREIKAEWERDIYYLVKEAKIPPLGHALVTATIYLPDKRKRDLDNFEGPLKKMVQDGLVYASVIPDDTTEFITWDSVEFDLDRRHPRTVIRVLGI
jgi:Holliday junction resolvase RusA-like endonuclease